MNDIPPKHAPEDTAASSGNLVSFYQAASNANAESFPVLKAFQDYIETERAQARKRVVTLSVFFSVVVFAVVVGFLATGFYLLQGRDRDLQGRDRDRAQLQDKLLELAFAPRPAAEPPAPIYITPPVPAPAPAAPAADLVKETVEEITKVTAALQSDISKRIDGVSEISSQVHQKVTSQEAELEKLRQELGQVKEQNEQLRGNIETVRTSVTQPPPAVAAVPAEPAAPAVAPPPAEPEAPPPAPEPPKVAAEDPRFPPATKEPPVTPEGVNPPDPPPGMMATVMPLELKNIGTIPWRVIIPE